MNHSCNTHEKFFLLIYLFCCFLFFSVKNIARRIWQYRSLYTVMNNQVQNKHLLYLHSTTFPRVTTNFFITVFDIFWFDFFCSILSYSLIFLFEIQNLLFPQDFLISFCIDDATHMLVRSFFLTLLVFTLLQRWIKGEWWRVSSVFAFYYHYIFY